MEIIYVYRIKYDEHDNIVKIGRTINSAEDRMQSYCVSHNITPVRDSLKTFEAIRSYGAEKYVHKALVNKYGFKDTAVSGVGMQEVFIIPLELDYDDAARLIGELVVEHNTDEESCLMAHEIAGSGFARQNPDDYPRHGQYDPMIDNEWYELRGNKYVDTYPYEARGEERPNTPEAQRAIKKRPVQQTDDFYRYTPSTTASYSDSRKSDSVKDYLGGVLYWALYWAVLFAFIVIGIKAESALLGAVIPLVMLFGANFIHGFYLGITGQKYD